MSSYGGSLNCNELHADKIYWKDFVPPIAGGGGGDTLATVLSNGNDANDDIITNLNKLEVGTVEVSAKVESPLVETTSLEVGQCDVSVNADGLRMNGTKSTITNFDLTSATNEFPPALREDIEAVLIEGSNANGQSITGLLGINSTNSTFNTSAIGTITTDSIEPLTTNPGITAEIGKNNAFHAITSETLTANAKLEARAAENGAHLPKTIFYSSSPVPTINGDLENGRLRCTSIQVDNQYDSASPAVILSESVLNEGIIASSGLVQSQKIMRTPLFDCVDNTDGTKGEFQVVSGGKFTGTTTGSPPTGQCEFTNCDFRSSTNLFNSSPQEQYEWLSVWTNAITNFPPPDGWKPYEGSQIPPINLVVFDFDQDRNTGWRYFAPQSDSDCQIDSDDKMGLNEGDYINAPDNNLAWKYAFYGLTASTTIPSHASQVVEFQFPVVQYGYGRIYMGLSVQPPPYTSIPLILNSSFRLVMEHEGAALSTNPRLNGPITMRWYLKDTFPVNGDQWRVYPMVRTDDTETTSGRMLIKIGDGQPLNGCNPGDPPQFDPTNTNAQQGQLLLRGYPVPQQFYEFPNPPGVVS
jgi:hypothetical protein